MGESVEMESVNSTLIQNGSEKVEFTKNTNVINDDKAVNNTEDEDVSNIIGIELKIEYLNTFRSL